MKQPSDIDRRRLRDGAFALETSDKMPETADGCRTQLRIVSDGICALQSLDDLGPERNAQAARDEKVLWERYRALERRLKELAPPCGCIQHR